MPKQVEVLVKDISTDEFGRPTELTGTTRILTYKSFNYLNANPDNPRYELIGEVDDKGKLVPGSPNLNAQHRSALQPNAGHAASVGPSQKEKDLQAENEKLKAMLSQAGAIVTAPQEPVSSEAPVKERQKPGPKKKQKHLTETSIEA
jgi:hypothetical protein